MVAIYYSDDDDVRGLDKILKGMGYDGVYLQIVDEADVLQVPPADSDDLVIAKASSEVAEALARTRVWRPVLWWDPEARTLSSGKIGNPWAICNKVTTKDDKQERCIEAVKASLGGWEY